MWFLHVTSSPDSVSCIFLHGSLSLDVLYFQLLIFLNFFFDDLFWEHCFLLSGNFSFLLYFFFVLGEIRS